MSVVADGIEAAIVAFAAGIAERMPFQYLVCCWGMAILRMQKMKMKR